MCLLLNEHTYKLEKIDKEINKIKFKYTSEH